jgi:hypothetical protein
VEVENGELLNGTRLNGTRLNGTRLNGTRLNGTRLNGTRLNGTALEGTLDDTGVTLTGLGFAGVDVDADLATGDVATVHIESVSSTDVPGFFTYEITYQGVNICGATGAKALAVAGRWDYTTGAYVADATQFTVACRGAAIAKCEEWGYPRDGAWTESDGARSHAVDMTYLHDACTRMVRADYCGDGVPHTVTGTLIDVWDAASIQTQTLNSGLPFEAEWSPAGATCVRHTRWATTADSTDVAQYIQDHCPSKWAPANASCGGDATGGSTFFTSNGYSTDPAARGLLRNASAQH